ncbi:1-deoxy-D-xylulose-5-phosphate reductoisomerase [Aliidiomarina iranensis]|uniref:1-deoxy-D-xylulose 5-phosphate reductoisomerase n=1 Tax=Aliidiomarina iranensis TaxID=1434071 RepID=A0A432W0M4_9GAMM|nr:1-deoxy-D-xylulose-5-phosphate reductoisomerase [Aliidiomarina iranensis]RUO22538.1 1-deoxy-D-xylulose-5-phosphate reductoisomerase [Aliidiomarina iranensis]
MSLQQVVNNTSRSKPAVITVLGATGSIGLNTLDVIARHPNDFELFAVTAHSRIDTMRQICERFQPRFAVMGSEHVAATLRLQLRELNVNTEVLSGEAALCNVSEAAEVDTVMAAIVGAAGLLPTLAAVKASKRVLLANKEALVMSGQLFIDAVRAANAQLLPVDSEHNAIFQALPETVQQNSVSTDFAKHGIRKILLTGSGGPFRQTPLADLGKQTPAAACAHPNWDMGQKISVDSATMLNKGLEYIEARWLFNCQPQQIEVVLHPQSVIHSMVQYVDGSVIAQMGQPDMRTPIAYCLGYPERLNSGVQPLDFTSLGELTFGQAEAARYPCLQLAIDACWQGQAATTTLNAANEEAVSAFLKEQIAFGDIAKICENTLAQSELSNITDIEGILDCDARARRVAHSLIMRG